MKRTLFLILPSLLIIGCEKPDPNPEARDPIFADLTAQSGEVEHLLAEEEKKLEGYKKDLESVVPQTGQIKFAQKKLYESEALINKLKQEKAYLDLKAKQRIKDVKKIYLKAFKAKKEWPDPGEFEAYKTEMKLRRAKKEWDVKQRMKEAGITPSGGGSEGKAEGHGEKEEKAEH